MKAIASFLGLALVFVPSTGGAAKGLHEDHVQTVKGRIEHGHQVLGFGVDEGGCLFVAQRLLLYGSRSTNGVTGFGFKVDRKTFGEPFSLTPMGRNVPGDLDIAFYRDEPGPSDAFNTARRRAFTTRVHQGGQQGEYGIVPRGFSHALVCYSEVEGRSVDFRYEAGATASLPRSKRI
jgi:hypothetical protein